MLLNVDQSNPELESISSLQITTKVNNNKMASKKIRTAQIRLMSSHQEVYEPCDDSFALVDALLADCSNLLKHCPALCMEIGCGSGYVITSLALMLGQEGLGVNYIATDINPHAVSVTRETLNAHGVDAELIITDIASGLEKRLAGLVDVIVVNPPYVPTPEDEVGADGITASWAGGENGRCVIDRILPVADHLLSEKGWLYMVTLTANNPSEICLQMREKGYASRIVIQRSTEEESLHIIKFWRDSDIEVFKNEKVMTEKSVPARLMDYVLTQFPLFSFWRSSDSDNKLIQRNPVHTDLDAKDLLRIQFHPVSHSLQSVRYENFDLWGTLGIMSFCYKCS
ncbi:hemK methyltransferase family member 2 [Senna tora]|uniref:HemK methyltransferase family member 2 n=1 Tax=Senna tora TaxID=362788 RepID=A0A834X1L5_9FABA|nr:hemK methyltransferase family member 2 [Senna tora]